MVSAVASREEDPSSISVPPPGRVFLCVVCMFSPRLRGFSGFSSFLPQSEHLPVRLTADSQTGVNVGGMFVIELCSGVSSVCTSRGRQLFCDLWLLSMQWGGGALTQLRLRKSKSFSYSWESGSSLWISLQTNSLNSSDTTFFWSSRCGKHGKHLRSEVTWCQNYSLKKGNRVMLIGSSSRVKGHAGAVSDRMIFSASLLILPQFSVLSLVSEQTKVC